MSEEIGIQRCAVIGNKLSVDDDRVFLEQAFTGDEYLGHLPYSATIRRADREDVSLMDIADADLLADFRRLWTNVVERSTR